MRPFKWKFKLFLIAASFTFLLSNIASAQTNGFAHQFPVDEWNKQIDTIEKSIPSQEWTVESLEKEINKLDDIQTQAEKCVTHTQNEIDKINKALAKPASEVVEAPKSPAESYEDKTKGSISQFQTQCKLTILRTNDLSASLQKKQDSLTTSLLLQKNTSIAGILIQLSSNEATFAGDALTQIGSKIREGVKDYVFILLLTAVIGCTFLIGYRLKIHSLSLLVTEKKRALFTALFSILYRRGYAILFAILASAAFLIQSYLIEKLTLSAILSTMLLGYIIINGLFYLIFSPPYPAKALIQLPGSIPRLFANRLFYLTSILFISAMIYQIFYEMEIPHLIIQLAIIIFWSLISISLISIISVITRIPKIFYDWKFVRHFLNSFFNFFLFVIIIAEWSGYHNLAVYLILNLGLSILLIFSTWIVHIIFRRIVQILETNHRFRKSLGTRANKEVYELHVIRYTLNFVIWLVAIISFLNLWIISEVFFNHLINAFIHGFVFLNINIAPARIIFAILIFCTLSLLSRWLKTKVSQKSRDYIEEGAQVAIGTIVGYIGFAFSVLTALLIAGVNFTGLAIIAGALSVGIGFGLQSIANDLISGLILLIETPIKAGDRIKAGEVEGFVRRIRLRSTHIRTLSESDIFIPNSQIISSDLTNYVFYNQKWRIECFVGVAYGSDLELVRNLLLKVALTHPDVLKDKPDKPSVFLKEFGNNSIDFELRCIIDHVNKKYRVHSELNFAIAKIFNENNITIPFPQQDLYIKEWPDKNKDK